MTDTLMVDTSIAFTAGYDALQLTPGNILVIAMTIVLLEFIWIPIWKY